MPRTGHASGRLRWVLLAGLLIGAAVVSAPAAGQPPGGQPPGGQPPGGQTLPPLNLSGIMSPEASVDAAIKHLEERRGPLLALEIPNEVSDAAFWYVISEGVACIIAVSDLGSDLRRRGETRYKDDPEGLARFQAKMKEFQKARGTDAEREETGKKIREKIDQLRAKMKNPPSDEAIVHRLYHDTTLKKTVIARQFGIAPHGGVDPVEAKRLKILGYWTVIDCPGEECKVGTTR